ncbi:MAG: hypothetical protein ACREIT_07735, partial [Tepidisphaeraceae bacterium]
ALKKDYQEGVDDPDKARTTSDFFTKTPNAELTPELVITALEKPIKGGSAPEQTYVKWQLVSALPSMLEDEALVKRLVKVYEKSPKPEPRPGISPKDRQKLDRMVAGAKRDSEFELRRKYEAVLEEVRLANVPVLGFRNALFAKLPDNADAVKAGLKDAYERLITASDASSFINLVTGKARIWANGADVSGGDARQIIAMVAELE